MSTEQRPSGRLESTGPSGRRSGRRTLAEIITSSEHSGPVKLMQRTASSASIEDIDEALLSEKLSLGVLIQAENVDLMPKIKSVCDLYEQKIKLLEHELTLARMGH